MGTASRGDGIQYQNIDGVCHHLARVVHGRDGTVITAICGKVADARTNDLIGSSQSRCQRCIATSAVLSRSGRRAVDTRPAGYRPIRKGTRHRTRLDAEPPAGTVVHLLCGGWHRVRRRDRAPHIYDCHACDEVANQ
ncbi:hypothetical protein [Amycolatopsis nigrescens]|uniref:hypothetical protein n=1 Tax=Amycolatopsis nigrescens TaxID=381445 RepID=UPI00037DFE4F|nr:hypothetical protein [Amycolatopsis nigrescens]